MLKLLKKDDNKNGIKLKYSNIVNLLDARFEKKNILYEHLFASHNDYISRLINNISSTQWIFEENNPVGTNLIYRYYITFEDLKIRPTMINNKLVYPLEAQIKSMSYNAKLIGKAKQTQIIYDLLKKEIVSTTVIGEVIENMDILPIMTMVGSKICATSYNKKINSGECIYDTGGYFITKGKEKIIIPKERKVENKTLVYKKKDGSGANVYEIYQAEINSKAESSLVQPIKLKLKKNNSITIVVPIFQEISIFILLRAMGLNTDLEIVNYIIQKDDDPEMLNILKLSIEDSKRDGNYLILSSEDAINYIITKIKIQQKYTTIGNSNSVFLEKKQFVKYIFENAFLPHIDSNKYDNCIHVKALFLCNMLNKLLNCYLGRIPTDDRDMFINKRIELPGDTLYEETMKAFKKELHNMNKIFWKRTHGNHDNPPNILSKWKQHTIETALINLLSKGENSEKTKTGISQPLPRTTRLQSITFLRRIDSPSVDDQQKLTGPRHYNPSQIGFIDAIESPEHANIGLVKHLSLLGTVSIENKQNSRTIYTFLKQHDKFMHINNITLKNIKDTKIFLNGEWVGSSLQPYDIYEDLKKLKNVGLITKDCGITFDIRYNEINVHTESGRLIREIFKVKNNKLVITNEMIEEIINNKSENNINKWDLLMIKYPDAIDIIDNDEQYFSLIAEKHEDIIQMYENEQNNYEDTSELTTNRYDNSIILNYSHCEIHPVCLLGIMSSCIIFADHNQGPRNIYQFAQGKQAMGIPITNYRDRMDISHILYNTQKPLVNSIAAKYSNQDVMPCGENCIVAHLFYTGMNIEDSLIFNQTSIERGLFMSSTFRVLESKIEKNQTTGEDGKFAPPSHDSKFSKKNANYDKLNDKGYVPVGTELKNNDVVICKITPFKNNDKKDIYFKDNIELYKGIENAYVDKVYDNITNVEGYKMIKVKTRSLRIPTVGDKFCCYTDDHEVLTFDGWKNIKDISKNDKIACLNNGTTLEYRNPIETMTYNFEGELYEIDDNISLRVTKNHRMYIGDKNTNIFSVKTAEEIYGEEVIYKKNIDIYHPEKKYEYFEYDDNNEPIKFIFNKNKFNEISVNLNRWCVIFGLLIKYNYNSYVNFKESLRTILYESNLSMDINEINLWDSSFSMIIYCYFLSLNVNDMYNKYLPEWTKYLTKTQTKLLIHNIMTVEFDEYYIFNTLSNKFKDDLQHLCFHAGYASYIKKNVVDVWTIIINEKDLTFLSNFDYSSNKYLKKDKYVNYEGKVYCCDVGGDGIIYIRRNGKVVWCCNSRSGQKGSVGLTLSSSDMPFTSNGLVPDIILNPHAIPSRMTTSHLMEQQCGLLGILNGMEYDGTAFQNVDCDAITEMLVKYGFDKTGKQTMYNGLTGRKFHANIYIGPIYYQRLKHMVSEKVHAVAIGPTTMRTRQPTEGRSKDGGFRIGEMERDCLISHGVSLFLKERLVDCSDIYEIHVCDICGLFAKRIVQVNSKSFTTNSDKYECVGCMNTTKITKVIIPYAFKLLINELMAMCIAPRIRTK
jgi:DNA-directed RNA polymerase II subunit RPB2